MEHEVLKGLIDNFIIFNTPCKIVALSNEKEFVFFAKKILNRDDTHILIINKFGKEEAISIKKIIRIEEWRNVNEQ